MAFFPRLYVSALVVVTFTTARFVYRQNANGSDDCTDPSASNCVDDPCNDASCLAFPGALCKPNYCGGCNVDWYVDEETPVRVDCENPELTPLDICPSGWELHNRRCYFLNNFYSLNQANAIADCKRRGGHLVAIESASEQNFIETLPLDKHLHYWTSGMRKSNGDSVSWIWSGTGEELLYTKWNRYEPNNEGPGGTTEDGVSLKSSGSWGWNDVFSRFLFYSICEAPLGEVLTECDSQPCLNGGSCTRGRNGEVVCSCVTGFSGSVCEVDKDDAKWYPFNGHSYQIFSERGRDRPFAAAVCEDNRASLVSINDREEQEFLARILEKAGLQNAYTFFHTSGVVGARMRWQWGDGTEMEYTAWGSGEPNYHKGENMVQMVNKGRGWRWNDIVGIFPTAFICERDHW